MRADRRPFSPARSTERMEDATAAVLPDTRKSTDWRDHYILDGGGGRGGGVNSRVFYTRSSDDRVGSSPDVYYKRELHRLPLYIVTARRRH